MGLTEDDLAPIAEAKTTTPENTEQKAKEADNDVVAITAFANKISQIYQQHDELVTKVLEKHGVFSNDATVRAKQNLIMSGESVALTSEEQQRADAFSTSLNVARLKLTPESTAKSDHEKLAEELARQESQKVSQVVAVNSMKRPELSMNLASDVAELELLLQSSIVNNLLLAIEKMPQRQRQLGTALLASSLIKSPANSQAMFLNALSNHYNIQKTTGSKFPVPAQDQQMGWTAPAKDLQPRQSPLTVR